ncbi:hypothetical protein STEG23_000026, partial [Scotinomys teguina]
VPLFFELCSKIVYCFHIDICRCSRGHDLSWTTLCGHSVILPPGASENPWLFDYNSHSGYGFLGILALIFICIQGLDLETSWCSLQRHPVNVEGTKPKRTELSHLCICRV